MRFLDSCQGLYCNMECPDELQLGELTSNNWPIWARVIIAAVILLLGMLSMLMKMLFAIWLFRLERQQDDYLLTLDNNLAKTEATLMVRLRGAWQG